eukprot:CAMPEP_0203758970 /NCGR_PEP_ID=MMETSP0098-20131031/11880_1 /ASSEMBLY_ACC=CAM_ASM_000208 /TAXON_ID=96639 /ORGANISM=" , Strain NY0313808BC1" /LENGTH=418 /DNA_ID=CAMNT_0050651667 /DNA_START=511 /DNA_END=1764 /DNA_ORIENTATION=+
MGGVASGCCGDRRGNKDEDEPLDWLIGRSGNVRLNSQLARMREQISEAGLGQADQVVLVKEGADIRVRGRGLLIFLSVLKCGAEELLCVWQKEPGEGKRNMLVGWEKVENSSAITMCEKDGVWLIARGTTTGDIVLYRVNYSGPSMPSIELEMIGQAHCDGKINVLRYCSDLLVSSSGGGRITTWELQSCPPDDSFNMRLSELATIEDENDHSVVVVGLFSQSSKQGFNDIGAQLNFSEPFIPGEETCEILQVTKDGTVEIIRTKANSKSIVICVNLGDYHVSDEMPEISVSQVAVPRANSHNYNFQEQFCMPKHKFSIIAACIVDVKTGAQSIVLFDLRRVESGGSPFVKTLAELPASSAPINALTFGPYANGPVVYGTADGSVRTLDLRGHTIKDNLTLRGNAIFGLLVLPDNSIW